MKSSMVRNPDHFSLSKRVNKQAVTFQITLSLPIIHQLSLKISIIAAYRAQQILVPFAATQHTVFPTQFKVRKVY